MIYSPIGCPIPTQKNKQKNIIFHCKSFLCPWQKCMCHGCHWTAKHFFFLCWAGPVLNLQCSWHCHVKSNKNKLSGMLQLCATLLTHEGHLRGLSISLNAVLLRRTISDWPFYLVDYNLTIADCTFTLATRILRTFPQEPLRSEGSSRPFAAKVRKKTFGKQLFFFRSLTLWNGLPLDVG